MVSWKSCRLSGYRNGPSAMVMFSCATSRRKEETMGKLIYAMMVSLDGFIEGPDGELDWHVIDEELHRHFNDLESEMYMLLYGRCLY
jgi:hypothetical protein